MNRNKKVLILTCSHGSGHKMVSAALRDTFEKQGCTPIVRDLFNETNRLINTLIEKSYLLSYNIGSAFYEKMYYDVEKDAHSKFIYKLWSLTEKTLLTMIEEERPDCIINTYPYTISSILKKINYPGIPVYTVVTDFCIPAAWQHPDTDRYYVACDNVENHLLAYGAPQNRILKTGIPIRDTFYGRYDKRKLQEKYSLDPHKRTLIISAGTYGVVKNLNEICAKIDKIGDLQAVVVCGKNKALYKSLISEQYKNIHILGFVSDIHELYFCGDFMVTKPGGISLSEAVATRIPLILYNPVPGQEGENAEWFKNIGAAIITKTTAELLIAIESLKGNEVKQYAMKSALKKMYYGHAAECITTDILTHLSRTDAVLDNNYNKNDLFLLKEN